MERFVLPVWDLAVSIVRRKSEASSEALEAPSIMRTHLGGEVHEKEFTKSERKILKLLAEGALLSLYGPSNQEIMNYTSLSKRTVITAMNKFRRMNLLDDTKIGKIYFHKLRM